MMMMNWIRIGNDRRNEWSNGQRMDNMPTTITRANDTELTGTPNAPNKPKPRTGSEQKPEPYFKTAVSLWF